MLKTLFAIGLLLAIPTGAIGQLNPRFNVAKPVKRLAFVVGNGNYTNAGPLPGSVEDARAMTIKLESLGFTVFPFENIQTRDQFLEKFLTFVEQIEEGSFVVLYFSGHGFTYGGESYLVPLQFPAKVLSTRVNTTFISTSGLLERINLRHPGLLIMFLDACRNIGGFIVPAAGGAPDVDKGLASLATGQNNIIGYATEPGKIAVGNAGGSLSRYTAALAAHIATPDSEFDKIHKAVVGDVREMSSNTQNPWRSDSSTLEVYFNPSAEMLNKFREQWEAAQRADTPKAVQAYLNLFGLGQFGESARKWLEERADLAKTFTQFSTTQIDALWASAQNSPAFSTRITGPFGLERVTSPEQPIIQSRAPRKNKGIQRDPWTVANVLAGSQSTIILEPLTARARPDANATAVASLEVGAKIAVKSVEQDASGDVWIGALSQRITQSFYVKVPSTAGTLDVTIGRAVREFELEAGRAGSAFADPQMIENVLDEIKSTAGQISWVSISVPKLNTQGYQYREKDALLLRARATHGAYLLTKRVPRGRISVIESADFSGESPRVRIFGQ